MEWNVPYVVYRINNEGKFEEVFHADNIKKAKYWLTYIAQPGDVLCKTPSHPKHSGKSNCPEYFSHKTKSGTTATDEQEWLLFAKSINSQESFPKAQMVPNADL
jgi:hypothetical protein